MDYTHVKKNNIEDLAFFGGGKFFSEPKSTSSLAQPDFESFLSYSERFFERQHYTNNGVLVKELESRLAKFHSTKFCIAFCSGFWALALTISTLALKGKTEIVMPSLTYRRMADIAAWTNLKPRFCEVDSHTLSPNIKTVRECITNETALILGVQPIVNCTDIQGIGSLGDEFGIPVLFDSVESMYESTSSGKVGGFGNAECFSMHASKLLNGFEGGYVTTNDADLARELGLLRSFGFFGQDNCIVSGALNAKLNEVHAAMALANLDKLERVVAKNKQNYRAYQKAAKSVDRVRLLSFEEKHKTSYKNIVIELLDGWPITRDQIVEILNAENVLARAYYNPPLHQKSMDYPYVPATLEMTDSLASRYILMPSGEFVDTDDIAEIALLFQFIHTNALEIKLNYNSRK